MTQCRADSFLPVQSRLQRLWLQLGKFVLPALGLFALLAVQIKASAADAAVAPPASARPRLVVLLVVDGLPQRQLLAYRDQLAPDGFARFLGRGAWFANAHHGHAFTVTAAGHAALLTGAYPERTGIIGNDWRDPATGAAVYCTADAAATYIGHKTNPLDGTSPKNLKAETLGDVLQRADGRSKVIAISGKDRGAILPAGQTGTAYMYMSASGQFASSTYYMQQHPAWVNAFNAQKPADRYFRAEWKALLPEAAYARSLPDQQLWFGPAGGGLPTVFGSPDDDEPGPRFYASLLRSPFVDALSLDFARVAITGEQLGQDDSPDILVVSLSGHDYVNHAYSAESRLSHDHFLQLDRQLQSFFSDLDVRIGKANYLTVLTADHGFMPNPERSAQLGLEAGRVNGAQVAARLNAGLEARFGGGRWVLGYSGSSVLFDKNLAVKQRVDLAALADVTRRLLLAEPGFAAAYTRADFETGRFAAEPLFAAMRRAWHPQISGEVQYSLKPGWMFGSAPATHGSPHPYDTQVPILMYGPAWVKPGPIDAAVAVVDIAPTLARLLGVAAPAASQGTVLPLAGF
jgi:predicted AlkP superfamily pyrophosphatase or phosphodiesterase